MALTRPTAAQIVTTTSEFSDPLILVNKDQTGTNNNDIGFIFNRGSDTNVGILWDESTDAFSLINTSSDGSTEGNVSINSYADLAAGSLTASGINYPTTDGTNGQFIRTDGSGNLTFASVTATPGGNNTQVQYNNNGELDGSSNLTFDGTTLTSNSFSGQLTGNADTASSLSTARTISLGGDLSGSASFDGSSDITITASVDDDSHNHTIANVDGLQTALNGKLDTTAKAADSELLDGFDSSDYQRIIRSVQKDNLSVGWYTIATNTGNRAIAKFGIRDTDSGDHQSAIFYASHNYGRGNSLTLVHCSHYSGDPFRYIRIKEGGTYNGAMLQVYIDKSDNRVQAFIVGDNFQSSGWSISDWIPDGTDPGGGVDFSSLTNVAAQIDIDEVQDGGISTTGPIYAGGDTTQYKVWHAGNDGSGSGLDADLLDGLNSSQFLRSDTSDTISGNLSVTGSFTASGLSYPSSDGTIGQVIVTDGSGNLTFADQSGGGYTASSTAPSSPNPGDEWWDTDDGSFYKYIDDGTSEQWVEWGPNNSLNGSELITGNLIPDVDNTYDIGSATKTLSTVYATATSAQYADLAENYLSDCDYPVGTVLEIGGTAEVTAAEANSYSVAGTVSDKPAYLMNSGLTGEYVVPVAYIGRVPCRVVGKVHRGDLLKASSTPGVAQRVDPWNLLPGQMVGKALESYNSNQEGIIEIMVGRL